MSSHHSSSTSYRSSHQPLRQRTGHGSDAAAPGGPPVHQYSGSASRASSTHHRDRAAPQYYGGNQGPAPQSSGAPGHHGSVGHRSTWEAPIPRETIAASGEPLQNPYVYPPARYITSSPEPIPDRRSIDHSYSRAQTQGSQTSSSTRQHSYAAPPASGTPSRSRDASASASGHALQQRPSGERTSRASTEHESGGSARRSEVGSYRHDAGARSREGSTMQVMNPVDSSDETFFYWKHLTENYNTPPYHKYSAKVQEIIHVSRSLLVADQDNSAARLVGRLNKMDTLVGGYSPMFSHKDFIEELDQWFQQLSFLETAEGEARRFLRVLGKVCRDSRPGQGYAPGENRAVVRSSGSTHGDPCFDMAVTFAALVCHYANSGRGGSEGDAQGTSSNQVDEAALIEAFLNSDLTMAGDSRTDEPLVVQYKRLQNAIIDAIDQFKSMRTHIKSIYVSAATAGTAVTGVRSGLSDATHIGAFLGMCGVAAQVLENSSGGCISDPNRTYVTQHAASSEAYLLQGDAYETLMGLGELSGSMQTVLDERAARRRLGGRIPTKLTRQFKMEMVESLRSISKHFLPLPGQSIQTAAENARDNFLSKHWNRLSPDGAKMILGMPLYEEQEMAGDMYGQLSHLSSDCHWVVRYLAGACPEHILCPRGLVEMCRLHEYSKLTGDALAAYYEVLCTVVDAIRCEPASFNSTSANLIDRYDTLQLSLDHVITSGGQLLGSLADFKQYVVDKFSYPPIIHFLVMNILGPSWTPRETAFSVVPPKIQEISEKVESGVALAARLKASVAGLREHFSMTKLMEARELDEEARHKLAMLVADAALALYKTEYTGHPADLRMIHAQPAVDRLLHLRIRREVLLKTAPTYSQACVAVRLGQGEISTEMRAREPTPAVTNDAGRGCHEARRVAVERVAWVVAHGGCVAQSMHVDDWVISMLKSLSLGGFTRQSSPSSTRPAKPEHDRLARHRSPDCQTPNEDVRRNRRALKSSREAVVYCGEVPATRDATPTTDEGRASETQSERQKFRPSLLADARRGGAEARERWYRIRTGTRVTWAGYQKVTRTMVPRAKAYGLVTALA
ncbi:hypothetical protein EV714DRAFT_239380 [Schizophyllum commune]